MDKKEKTHYFNQLNKDKGSFRHELKGTKITIIILKD